MLDIINQPPALWCVVGYLIFSAMEVCPNPQRTHQQATNGYIEAFTSLLEICLLSWLLDIPTSSHLLHNVSIYVIPLSEWHFVV
jgi:hypothetical protein